MKFENIGLLNKTVELELLDEIFHDLGFVRAGQWDYERVTFDYKFEDMTNGSIYYCRVQAYAVEGDVGSSHAVMKVLTPLLGKHYYPHGVEYDGENFPNNIVAKCQKLLEQAVAKIDAIQQ
jgi:hypothetical protein